MALQIAPLIVLERRILIFALSVYGWSHLISSHGQDLAWWGLSQLAFAWVLAGHDCRTGGQRFMPAVVLDMIGFFGKRNALSILWRDKNL